MAEEDGEWKSFEEALARGARIDAFLPATCVGLATHAAGGPQRRDAGQTVENVYDVNVDAAMGDERGNGDDGGAMREDAVDDDEWPPLGEGEVGEEWSALRAIFTARMDAETALCDGRIASVDALALVFGIGGDDVGMELPMNAMPPAPLPGPAVMLRALDVHEQQSRGELKRNLHRCRQPVAAFMLVHCLPRWMASRHVARASVGAAALGAVTALGLHALDRASFDRVLRHLAESWSTRAATSDALVAALKRDLIGAYLAASFRM